MLPGRARARSRWVQLEARIQCMRLSSSLAPPLIQERKTGVIGKVFCLGELQRDADYRSVATLSPIAEEGGVTLTYDTSPIELLATSASPVLCHSKKKHAHLLDRWGRHRAALIGFHGKGALVTYMAGVTS